MIFNKFIWLPITSKYNKKDTELSAKLEFQQDKKGKICSRIDTMIAAIAINRKAKIYTFNKKHFQTIEQLKLVE